MKIKGLQKLTLLDYPEKMAATIFLGGCNFRCPFCHNAGIVLDEDEMEISQEEVFAFLKKRKGILDGVCITGGEPLLHGETKFLIQKIKEMGYLVKLDTNGSFPKYLKELVEENLVDYVAVDLKNCKEKYGLTIGVENFNTKPIEETVEYLMKGVVPFEFRTTVVKEFHEKNDIKQIGQWIAGDEAYYLQQFIDSGNLIDEHCSAYPDAQLSQFVEVLCETVPNTRIRGI